MQVIYIALEIDKNETPTKSELSELFGLEKSKIDIKPLIDCKGDERAFRLLCDFYLWTNRYFHGIHETKLTCVRVKTLEEIAPEFLAVYSTKIKLAIKSNSLSVLKITNNNALEEIRVISTTLLGSERTERLKQYKNYLEAHYKVLKLPNSPY